MHAKYATPSISQHLEITARLRRFDNAEGVLLERNWYICVVVAGDLQEHTTVWTTLVSLSRGVKKTRTKAENGRGVLLVAYEVADGLQLLVVLGVHFDVSKQCEVIAPGDPVQMGFEVSGDGLIAA